MLGTNELIGRAFASRPRAENFRLLEVLCLDEHLQGHAFKYAAASSRIQGVYRYRLTYAVAGSEGERGRCDGEGEAGRGLREGASTEGNAAKLKFESRKAEGFARKN